MTLACMVRACCSWRRTDGSMGLCFGSQGHEGQPCSTLVLPAETSALVVWAVQISIALAAV